MNKLIYLKQDFNVGTCEILVDGNIVTCNMYQDKDGDFLFYYKNEPFWFKDCIKM